MRTTDRSHYQAMGLGPAAGPDEVRQAYLRLARTLHPDRFMDASAAERGLAERRMREVNAAWAVLGDPARRRDYDRELSAARAATMGSATGSAAAGPGAARSKVPDSEPIEDSDGWYVVRDDELDDDVELSRPMAFLLRRGPIIVILAVFFGLFVGTALADGRRDRDRIEQESIEQQDPAESGTTMTVCDASGGCG